MTGRLTLTRGQNDQAPVSTSRGEITTRRRAVLSWSHGDMNVSGEAVPLAGYGDDSFEAALEQLETLTEEQVETAIEEVTSSDSEESIQGLLIGSGTPLAVLASHAQHLTSSAARFCFETLVLGAASQARGVPLWRLFAAEAKQPPIPTSIVVDPLSPRLIPVIERAWSEGVRTFKLKCGRDWFAEREAIESLAGREGIHLRLDANAAWDAEAAASVFADSADWPLDWIEDPTPEPSLWMELVDPPRLAIDEGLTQRQPGDFTDLEVGAVILKPMSLGLGACLHWAAAARERELAICVSHFFDGPLAMHVYAHLAFAIQSHGFAAGLGFHAALSDADRALLPMMSSKELRLPA